jgi:putative two-component system hydrogenase maturation factor HypX/HoxX
MHPGIKGDQGPSSLDCAITNDERAWGVTILEAAEEFDAGPIHCAHHSSKER